MKNSKKNNSRGQMFEAICAECGQKCEVPFQPTGDKPVYCVNCFAKKQGSQPLRSNERDFRRRNRKMYSAICDKCGQPCQVPFHPTQGKPIYCDQCFGKDRNRGGDRGGSRNDQLASINAKLDKIINALILAKIMKPKEEVNKLKFDKKGPVKVTPIKEEKKKVAAKKIVIKKETAKKASIKKVTKKKK
jgi:CxxC-x17-CxxC domain-containing protein